MSTDGKQIGAKELEELIKKLENKNTRINIKRPPYKKRKCGTPRNTHYFNNQKPFGWQRCYCKKFTFKEIREKNRQNLMKQQGELV